MKMTAVLISLTVTIIVIAGQTAPHAQGFERGVLPDGWTRKDAACAGVAPFLVHEYNPTFIILRQSDCTNYEKPFLYLILGSKQALLVDTGASGADVSIVVEQLLRRDAQQQKRPALPLLAVHSHGHGDHTAGDRTLRKKPGVQVVDARPDVLSKFFTIRKWPSEIVQHDLGDRILDIIPIPGHEPASIAIYDRRTGILLTGDTLYPGRLYVADAAAFRDSVDRLVDFTATREVTHVLGAHIENTRTPYKDYPQGTTFQPDEHALRLERAHLIELRDALRQMDGPLQRRALRDFTIWPLGR